MSDEQIRLEGIREINSAKWIPDAYKCLNLLVHDSKGGIIHAYLSIRPEYCDRGHIQLGIEGKLDIDHQDSFPRFFFTIAEAMDHTRMFLNWRIWQHKEFDFKEWDNICMSLGKKG